MKIVNISEERSYHASDAGEWRWLEPMMSGDLQWRHHSTRTAPAWLKRIGSDRLTRFWIAFSAVAEGRKADLLVTHGVELAAAVGLARWLLRCRTPHLAWSFSMPRPEALAGVRLRYYRFALRHVARFVMFSTLETRIYPPLLKIPADRFEMAHWSTEPPAVGETGALPAGEPYLAAIGGEGRDYATLFEAMRRAPELRLVVVASPASVAGLTPPDNVDLRVNLPLKTTLGLAQQAEFMVLPLLSQRTPCGHGSLISQFFMGKATLVTEGEAMSDYIQPEENALTCPPGDPDAMAEAIRRLAGDEALRERLSRNGRRFAETVCSEAHTVDFMEKLLGQMIGEPSGMSGALA